MQQDQVGIGQVIVLQLVILDVLDQFLFVLQMGEGMDQVDLWVRVLG